MNTPLTSTPVLKPEWINPVDPKLVQSGKVRIKNIVIALLLSALFAAVLIFLAAHAFIAWMFANPQVPPLFSNPMAAKGMAYDTVTFPARDGHSLVDGWYIPAEDSTKTIVLSHGYGANREEYWVPMYDLAQFAHRLGYNVVMFDYGFASEQHKTKATGGRIEKEQLLGAVDLATERGAKQVIVWGFSMGAGTALQAGLVEDHHIDGMILDSTFLLEPDTLYHNVQQYVQVPKHPSLDILRMMFPLLNDTSMQQIPYQEVKQHQYSMPTLFIHGTEDTKAPYSIAEEIAANQDPSRSSSWIVSGAQHELIYRTHSKEYLSLVADYLAHVDKPSVLIAKDQESR